MMNICSFIFFRNKNGGKKMATREERFKAMREETRNKIKAVATKLFIQKSYEKTTMADIAKAAGVSNGLAYRYFSSKSELFGEIVEEATSGIGEVGRFLQQEKEPIDLVKELAEIMLLGLKEEEETKDLLLLVVQSLFSKDETAVINNLLEEDKRFIAKLAEVIEEGQKRGQFKEGDPLELAMHYIATYQGIGMVKLVFEEEYIFPDIEMILGFLIK
ncbi:transcriptional regulator, TetR family [Enterococcus faecalis 13-SD-W-01]|nr:transcriptional regulator, TetR family [Enterococcus faecalis 13-SD-W-01]